MVAVRVVSLTTFTFDAVMPGALTLTVVGPEAELRFVPVNVTVVLDPRTPLAGDIDVNVGTAAETWNGSELLSPIRGIDTAVKYFVATALAGMLKVAVREVSLSTLTSEAVTPPTVT